MEQMILSLKNLYNILKKYDFPVYSGSVIGKFEKKGMTMQGFWQRQMIEEFRCETYGRMIWRNDGKRNRYTSHLCNRSEELKCYPQYARELAAHINRETMLKQIHSFGEFLIEKEYKHDMFLYRVQEIIRLCEQEDPYISEEVVTHVREGLAGHTAFSRYGSEEKLFQASYLMTIMMIYASAGKSMCIPELAMLRKKEYGLGSLWAAAKELTDVCDAGGELLTEYVPFLQDNGLPVWKFFGREEELYDLKEMAVRGQKCLICGMGGIGKTELLRQLIRLCREQGIVDKMALVPCETDFVDSVIQSFGKYSGGGDSDSEEMFRKIIQHLKWDAKNHKVLILVDNYTGNKRNDEKLREFLDIPCGVLVTSRQMELEGFEIYRLNLPSLSTGALIFRDNYESPLEKSDRQMLNEMLLDETICHPLTLRLMARAAHNRNWSVLELKEQLEKKQSVLSLRDVDSTVRVSRIYRQLYSFVKIQKECRGVAELFSILPRDSYTSEFLQKWFPQVCAENFIEQAAVLTRGGWLDADEKGSSMHPLIAQCLRKKTMTEEQMRPFIQHICNEILQAKHGHIDLGRGYELQKLARIIIHMVDRLSGPVSQEMLLAVLISMNYRGTYRQSDIVLHRVIEKLMKNCADKDEQTEVAYQMVLAQMNLADEKTLIEVYLRQKTNRTVPEWLYAAFCVMAGIVLFKKLNAYAEEVLKTGIYSEEASPQWRAEAYYWLSTLYEYGGDPEQSLSCAEEGVRFAKEYFEMIRDMYIALQSRLCAMYIAYGRKEEAEKVLEEMKHYSAEIYDDVEKYNYLATRGLYELNFGNLEASYSYYEEGLSLIEPYTGKDRNYYMVQGQMAIILQRLKRYEEAVNTYHRLLEYAQEIQDEYMLHLFNNNIAVAYLEMKQPEQALAHLDAAWQIAKDMKGFQLGEIYRNQARAYRQLNDLEKEYECVKKSTPLLDANYGPEHPRSVEMRERLAELETIEREKKL